MTAGPLTAGLTVEEAKRLSDDWQIIARLDQLPPQFHDGECDWTRWLIIGGRGSGKTRAGAEWVRHCALGISPFALRPARRIALVAATWPEARAVMIEGESGLLAIHAEHERPAYEPSKRQLTWPNGTVAQLFSAESPEALRGPQFDAAWLDELAKWRNDQATWDMLQFALRLGERPRMVITTTPRPTALMKQLMHDEATVISRSRTADNAANLAPSFLQAVSARYGGTRLGRQELDGELLDDDPNALFRWPLIEAARVSRVPELHRIVVAVDPPAGSSGDACGIICAGRGFDGRAYILEDATVEKASPITWARRAAGAYHRWQADRLVAEVNQGGDMVRTIIEEVDASVAVRPVRATRGKQLRAEPVAALYEQARVHHVGTFPELEDQMTAFSQVLETSGQSPDRVDALVWALTALMLSGPEPVPRIRQV